MGGCAHDDELVQRALTGDARAFALLYVRYRNVVWKLAYYKLGDRDDADDVMQQTFLKALRELSRYRATGSFKAWLLTICRNACNDRRRSAKAVLSLERLEQDQLAGRASTVDAAEWMTVRSAISKLPCEEAVAWFLIDVIGCTSEEAAEVVEVQAASTIRSRLKNARGKLEQELCGGPGLVAADPARTAVCGLYHLPPQKVIVAALRQQPPRRHLRAPQHSLDLKPRLVMTQRGNDGNWTLLKFFEELERAVPRGERVLVVFDSTPTPDCSALAWQAFALGARACGRFLARARRAAADAMCRFVMQTGCHRDPRFDRRRRAIRMERWSGRSAAVKRSPRRRIGQSDGTAAPGRLPAKGRGHGDHGDPPDAVARAVDVLSRRIPPPPDDLDERIIALIAHEYETGAVGSVGGARASGGTARRTRRPALAMLVAVRGGFLAVDRRPLAMMLAAAVLGGLVATLMLALPGSAPQSQAAIVQIPLDEDCGSDTGDRHIIVAGVWTGVEAARFKKILERFRRETSIRVTYAYADKDRIARALDQRIARSCPPDVALLPQPGMLRDFAQRGKLKPLSASTSALMERNYKPLWSRLASHKDRSHKDRMYGVWLKAANKSTVWYSRRNFTAASVRPPATWRELRDVAERLRAVGIPPIAIAGADGWTLTDLFENVYLQSAGPASYDKLASGDLPWTDETVREALRLLSPILRRQRWIAGGARALRTGFGESVAQVFAEPRAAGMVFEGDFVRTQIDHLPQHVDRSDVAAFPFPSIGRRDGAVVVAGGDVAVQFTANGGARRLMRFLGTPQAAEPWARAGGFISPNRKLKLSTYPDPITRAQARALIVARTLRFDLSDLQPPAFGATAGHGMWAFFRRYLSGDTTTDALMRDLQNGARYARSCQHANVGVC